jgi:spermidine synthase
MLCLYHGRINHGAQYIDPAKAIVTAYPYGAPSLLALDFVHTLHKGQPLRLAVIGLGTGSMAMEAHAGDSVDFFELDPKIIAIARKYFRFLSSSKASVNIELGDGRLLLKRSDQRYDAICVDAFNGDAIPVHLLTLEAFRLYLERLKPHGFIILHITNSYVDLAPIVSNAARELGLQSCLLVYHGGIRYAVLTRNASDKSQLVEFAQKNGPLLSVTATKLPERRGLRLWTDDFSNLFSVLKWNSSL